jgi:signal transduction histidine kinase/DNA-binding NarL/FixJ family response regulator/HPt (histidine-containing phosphotransfer) domain-containing protein
MQMAGQADASEWRQRTGVEAILYWCAGSVILALLTALSARSWAPDTKLLIWTCAHFALGAAATACWGLLRRDGDRAFQFSQVVLVLSALAWGFGGVVFGVTPNFDYNMPLVLTIAGLATASVWLFSSELKLLVGVLVVLLAPMVFLLLGGRESEWSAALLSVLLVILNLLIERRMTLLAAARASAQQPYAAVIAAARRERQTRDVAAPGADSTELIQLRTEIERHRNLEKEMEVAKQAAEAANMAKGEFLATMSHEMRTPLNGIIPLLEILRDTKLEADQREYLNTSYQSARHLLRIIDDILDYSKIEANKLELETVGLNLREVVDSVVRLMDRPAENKGIKLTANFDPNVRLACRGDPVRLRQVLSNLVSNAIKFTEKGTVQIQISKRGETRTHTELLFAVRDTGMGIAPEKAEKLFQPFSQADTSTTRNYGGTGLGLVICKRIVALMGGKIGLKSEFGRGSVFWFSVSFLKAIGDVSSNRRDLSGSRALIVSSDQRLTQRLTGYCQSWGISQIATNTTADALSKLKSSATLGENWAFDVVLVDLGSMRNTAPALLRNVGREPVLERLRLVFIEGDEAPGAELQAESGRLLNIKRQFSESDLMSALNKLLEVEAPGERRFNLMEEAARLGAGDQGGGGRTGDAAQTLAGADAAPITPPAKLSGHALLVEDNPVNRQVAQRLLGLIGISFEVAENGKEAFDLMGRGGFDVVLMDCQMPVMDGYTSTRSRRTLEQEGSLPRVPIIAMTANAMAGDREKCLACGMDDYMSKPLNRGLLEQTIRKWMPKNRVSAPTPAAPTPVVSAPPVQSVPARLSEPVKMTPAHPAINESIVNELIDVMGSEFTSLVRVYLEDTPKNLQVLSAAAERGDVQAMIAPAHSLKSTSANLGAMALSDVSKLIEHGARAGTLRDALGMARQAGIEFRRASDELERLLQNAGG